MEEHGISKPIQYEQISYAMAHYYKIPELSDINIQDLNMGKCNILKTKSDFSHQDFIILNVNGICSSLM